MSIIKYSPSPTERKWCRDTIDQIEDYLPSQYSLVAQARLKNMGIELSRRYICDCKNLKRHDRRVVEVLAQMVRDYNKRPKLPTRDEIAQKYFERISS